MNCDLQVPTLGRYTSPQSLHPYSSSLSSSACSSSSSIFSVDATLSQTSSNSTSSANSGNISWEADDSWACPGQRQQATAAQANSWVPSSNAASLTTSEAAGSAQRVHQTLRHKLTIRTTDIPVPAEQRLNPRRCSVNQRPPPTLVRQSERKVNFVDSLVDSATQMVEVIWPLSVPTSRCEGASGRGVLPLRTFIQETLRRSRTSYSTLQVALYYLVLIKPHVPKHDFTMEQPEDMHSLRALQCGRRMFLAALILASKYLQDRNYSAKAWSKISGLKVCEINTNEMAFLQAVRWNLHIKESKWDRWQEVVLKYTPAGHPPPSPGTSPIEMGTSSWRSIVPLLTPELDTIDVTPRTPLRLRRSDCKGPVSSPLSACEPARFQNVTPVPFKVAQFLEPKPDIASVTPPLARLGPLPTPQLTPQSAVASTPAVGAAMAFGSRRPSMCAAMAQAQNATLARCTSEAWMPMPRCNGLEAYQFSGRRPSLALSTSSLSSSPESMISDNSSRSSRASSISSVSSSAWAPQQARLARLATCRNARLPYPAPQKQQDNVEFSIASEIVSSPDFENFNLDEVTSSPQSITPQKLNTPGTVRRKRSRSSVDLNVQPDANQLKNQPSLDLSDSAFDYAAMSNICNSVLPDPNMAHSFLLKTPEIRRAPSSILKAKALQSPPRSVSDRRVPVEKDTGRKRVCCATEAAEYLRLPGPGMWEGIL